MAVALRRVLGLARRRWRGDDADRLAALEERLARSEQALQRAEEARAQAEAALRARLADDRRAMIDGEIAPRVDSVMTKVATLEEVRGMFETRITHLERCIGVAVGQPSDAVDLVDRLLEIRLGQVESRFVALLGGQAHRSTGGTSGEKS